MYKQRTYIAFKLIFWGLLFLPGYFVISNIRQIHEAEMLREKGLRVKARVIGVKTAVVSTSEGSSATHYIPTVKYKTAEGIDYIRELPIHETGYSENDEIELLYYENRASEAVPNSYFYLFQNLVQRLITLVLLSALFGLVFYVFIRKAILS